jgi:hypothetical protein
MDYVMRTESIEVLEEILPPPEVDPDSIPPPSDNLEKDVFSKHFTDDGIPRISPIDPLLGPLPKRIIKVE